MSYDVTGRTFSQNITYNVSRIWNSVVPLSLSQFDGLTAKETRKMIAKGLRKLKNNPEGFRHLEPSNGWGRTEEVTELLEKMLIDSVLHPKNKWEIS